MIKTNSYVLQRMLHHAEDKSVLSFKTAGKPQTFVRTTVPTKVVHCPQQAVDRRINQAHKKITELQVQCNVHVHVWKFTETHLLNLKIHIINLAC